MDIQRINQHTSAFNEITHFIESENGKEKVEVWFARELQSVLGYARWENFYGSNKQSGRIMQVAEYQCG